MSWPDETTWYRRAPEDAPEPDPELESLLAVADEAIARDKDEALQRHEQRQDAHLARWLVETNGGGE